MHALRVNEGLQNQIMTFERQCWKTEQYSRRECIEIVRNPDTTNETKVCDLIEMAAGISITLESLNACHYLPSNQNDILIIKFLRKTDAEMVLSKKAKVRASIIAVLVLKKPKCLSMKVFAAL